MTRLLVALAALALAGCMGPKAVGEAPSIARAPADVLPPPVDLLADQRYDLALGPFDSVGIDILGFEMANREYTLDGEGVISFPMAGAIRAEGMSTTELAEEIERRLRENYMRNPDVTVNLIEQQSQAIVVDGEVETPGIYPVRRNMTLMSAVAMAGGTTEDSQTSSVLVFRNVGEQRYVGLYDLNAIRLGNYEDPVLYPDDTVVVSEGRTRRILESIQGIAPLITTPLILLLRQ